MLSNHIKIWGHRGCRGEYNPPENSLAAFQAAVEQEADGIELDVFLTKDAQLVVFHDETLEKLTNGQGSLVAHTLSELQRLHLKTTSGQLSDARIPTLAEVLNLIDRFRQQIVENPLAKNFVVNIEIKGTDIARPVADAIQERLSHNWIPENFQVSSGDMENLRVMKKALPQIPIGALFWSDKAPWTVSEVQLTEKLAEITDLQPQTVNLNLQSLTSAAVALIRKTNAKPLAWTYNEKNPITLQPLERAAFAAQLFDNGIETIITDYPREMRQLLDTY